MFTRRNILAAGSAVVATEALLGAARAAHAQAHPPGHGAPAAVRPAQKRPVAHGDYTPVTVPNGWTLPFRKVGGAKVFHLIAEPVQHEMAPGLKLECWGYNGSTPGPLIEVVEGDKVRIYVTNKLPEGTSVHWHGIILPNGMDGVVGMTQARIPPGETFKYEFVFDRPGTFMYHPHFDEMTQMALGMMGMIVVHPRRRTGPRIDRDFSLMLSEWAIEPGTRRPDPNVMNDFNMLTFNSMAFPKTEPLVVGKGERVRIRLGNLSAMDHHPIHIHGHHFKVVGTDGGPIPPSAQWPETTVLVPVGSTREIEFVADNPGDWPFHCHMTHHIMNQMGHDIPNLIGVSREKLDGLVRPFVPGYMTMGESGMGGHAEHMQHMPLPENSVPMLGAKGQFDYIDMGGMFTIVKVREGLKNYEDPGWYENPPGTVAQKASAEDLRRDGIG